jgi:hypothetical protein
MSIWTALALLLGASLLVAAVVVAFPGHLP